MTSRKIALIVLGVVVVGVALGAMYMMRSRQQDEQALLRTKLTANQVSMAKLIAEREDQQARLLVAQEQIESKKRDVEAARQTLSAASANWTRTDLSMSVPYDELLFKMAADWKLVLTLVTAEEAKALTVEGLPFDGSSFAVTVTGQPITAGFEDAFAYQDYVYEVVANILGFLNTLAGDPHFASARIDALNVTVPPMITDDEAVVEGTGLEQPVAAMTVTVYSRS